VEAGSTQSKVKYSLHNPHQDIWELVVAEKSFSSHELGCLGNFFHYKGTPPAIITHGAFHDLGRKLQNRIRAEVLSWVF